MLDLVPFGNGNRGQVDPGEGFHYLVYVPAVRGLLGKM